MNHISYPKFDKGTVQQRLDGKTLLFGNIPAQQSKSLTIQLLGDSTTVEYNFRNEFQKFMRKTRGPQKFIGVQGMGAITGGSVGERTIGDWCFDAVSGRRITFSFTSSANPSTDTFTFNSHAMVVGAPCVVTSFSTLTGLSINTLYWVINTTTNTFQLSASNLTGGAAINLGGTTGNVVIGTGLIEMWQGIYNRHQTLGDADPDFTFLKIGTNDIAAFVSATTCLNNLSTLLDLIRTSYPLTEIIVCDPLPFAPGSITSVNYATWAAEIISFITGISLLIATKGNKIGYANTSTGITNSDFQSDGVHLSRRGCVKEARNYITYLNTLTPTIFGLSAPRTPRVRTAQPAMVIDATSEVLTIPYNAVLSPEASNFAIGLWYYPTALPTDSTLRVIASYANTHPAGFLLGHLASSGNGGGIYFYLASGTPVIANPSGAYGFEVLKINRWHRIIVVCDRTRLQVGLFINGQLINWSPISSAWTVTENESTRIGTAKGFVAAQGLYSQYFIAKGSQITIDNALDFVERDYFEGQYMPGTSAVCDISEGTGVSVALQTNNITSGTITGATWEAALVTPIPSIDAKIDGTFNPEILGAP